MTCHSILGMVCNLWGVTIIAIIAVVLPAPGRLQTFTLFVHLRVLVCYFEFLVIVYLAWYVIMLV